MTRYCLLVFVAIVPAIAQGENWPRWRGPNSDGVAPAGEYPTQWSTTDNVAWQVKLPGLGASTPAVWGEQIFLTCGVDGSNVVLALDRGGKQLWQTPAGQERAGKHNKATGSNPSPVTDGQHVFVYFKSGDLACLDLSGKIVWQKNLQQQFGEDTLWWDLGTSPVLTKSAVVVACMHSGPSYLAAFDKLTGDVSWKQDRNVEAPSEASQSYTTPTVVAHEGQELIIVAGADHVTGHNAQTGQELWRVGGLNPEGNGYFRSIASPVVAGGLAIVPYARGQTLTAIRLGGDGDVTTTHQAWFKSGMKIDVPTPAAADGKIYICSDRGEILCLDAETGNQIWSAETEKSRHAFSASPILASGRIYATREDGTTFVIQTGDDPKVLSANKLDEFTVATPVFVDGQILIRTSEHLYCIGERRP